ncbi:MAG: glycosyltransferase family 2 protein [Tepidisphaeraceae bacterium]
MPLFSTIVPVYNREKLVGATLESVFAQEFTDQEVIVVDDGSTDGSLAVVSRYGPRVEVLQQQNKGPSAARNQALSRASGEYVAFLDSDDVWFPWTLATYARVINDHDRPAVITGRPFVFGQEAELAGAARDGVRVERFADYLASGGEWRWFGVSSFVIRRDVLRAAGGFDERWRVSEDADLMLRIGASGTFVHVASPYTFGYREHPASLKGDITLAVAGNRHLIATEASGGYPGGRGRRRERRRIIARHLRPFTLQLLEAGRRADAWAMYFSTLSWHVAEARWKYLLGFPSRAMRSRSHGKATP